MSVYHGNIDEFRGQFGIGCIVYLDGQLQGDGVHPLDVLGPQHVAVNVQGADGVGLGGQKLVPEQVHVDPVDLDALRGEIGIAVRLVLNQQDQLGGGVIPGLQIPCDDGDAVIVVEANARFVQGLDEIRGGVGPKFHQRRIHQEGIILRTYGEAHPKIGD